MDLLPVYEMLEENKSFSGNPLCQESLAMSLDFYTRIGFHPPWICYYASQQGNLVGCAAFKGRPVNGAVEIAYGVFDYCQNQGIGTTICRTLVELSLKTDPSVRITARTLPAENFSTRILIKNEFAWIGEVIDPEDGLVWEWEYRPPPAS
jgi:ribosomal-protein-alanine N-acetyltransferase